MSQVHLDINFSGVDWTWQMVELELEVLGHYQEMASRLIGQCIHTPHTTAEMGTLSTTILRRKYFGASDSAVAPMVKIVNYSIKHQ